MPWNIIAFVIDICSTDVTVFTVDQIRSTSNLTWNFPHHNIAIFSTEILKKRKWLMTYHSS